VDSSRRRFVGLCLAAPVLRPMAPLPRTTERCEHNVALCVPCTSPVCPWTSADVPGQRGDDAPVAVCHRRARAVILVGQRQSFRRAHPGQSYRRSPAGYTAEGRLRCVSVRYASRTARSCPKSVCEHRTATRVCITPLCMGAAFRDVCSRRHCSSGEHGAVRSRLAGETVRPGLAGQIDPRTRAAGIAEAIVDG
jgi:hypothetical protein